MKQNLVRLISEGVMIVFSVLLAFWIEKRSEEAGNREQKSLLSERLFADLVKDSVSYAEYMQRTALISVKTENLIDYVAAGKISPDSLAALLTYAELPLFYNSNSSTFLSIVNSGQLDLFEMDSLFLAVGAYYNYNESRMTTAVQLYNDNVDRYMTPFINLNFDRRYFFEARRAGAPDIDTKKFASREFVNIVLNQRDFLSAPREMAVHAKTQHDIIRLMRNNR